MATVYGGIDIPLANMAGVQAELDAAAEVIKGKAEALAAQHVKTGAYSKSFRVTKSTGPRGAKDRLVENTDPGAVPIEFGHVTKKGNYVVGQFILTRAVG